MRDLRQRLVIPVLVLAGFATVLCSGCGSDSSTTAPGVGPDDQSPPLAPLGLTVLQNTPTKLSATWSPSSEPDLAGYRVYAAIDGSFTCISGGSPIPRNTFSFSASSGTTYQIRVTAIDKSQNESAMSESATIAFASNVESPNATPGGNADDRHEDEQGPDARDPIREPFDLPTTK